MAKRTMSSPLRLCLSLSQLFLSATLSLESSRKRQTEKWNILSFEIFIFFFFFSFSFFLYFIFILIFFDGKQKPSRPFFLPFSFCFPTQCSSLSLHLPPLPSSPPRAPIPHLSLPPLTLDPFFSFPFWTFCLLLVYLCGESAWCCLVVESCVNSGFSVQNANQGSRQSRGRGEPTSR